MHQVSTFLKTKQKTKMHLYSYSTERTKKLYSRNMNADFLHIQNSSEPASLRLSHVGIIPFQLLCIYFYTSVSNTSHQTLFYKSHFYVSLIMPMLSKMPVYSKQSIYFNYSLCKDLFQYSTQ